MFVLRFWGFGFHLMMGYVNALLINYDFDGMCLAACGCVYFGLRWTSVVFGLILLQVLGGL